MKPAELLTETLAYMAPAKALEALPTEVAERQLPGAPHSIAEIVAHMNFWQNWFLERAQGIPSPMAAHAAEGWPPVAPGSWLALCAEFLAGLVQAEKLDPAQPVTPPFDFPSMAHYNTGDLVVHLAAHNAHHMGQVILLRQLMGAWPPPAG